MENLHFVLVTFMMISVTCQPPLDDDDRQLQSQVKRLMEQNKRLERQNRQLSVIMSGLQQMCSALNLQSGECEGKSNPTDGQSEVPERVTDIALHKLSSSGLKDDSVNITAIFTAPDNFNVYWWIMSKNFELIRTRGMIKIIEGGRKHASTVQIGNLNETYFIRFTVDTENESITIEFNLEALERDGDQDITIEPIKYPLNQSYISHLEEDMTFNITLNEDARDSSLASIEAYFSGLNTTSEPYAFYEVYSSSLYDAIDIKGKPTANGTKSLLTITLNNAYARDGGILVIQFPVDEASGFYDRFRYDQKLFILTPDSHEVIRSDSIGLYPLEKQMFIVKEQSLFCPAIGNPAPTVHLVKIHRDKEVIVPTETLVRDKYAHFVSVKLSAQEKTVKGTYICRASNGNRTTETQTEIAFFEEAFFDDKKTGVMKNTTKKVTVSCKATGVPRPILEIRLYDLYGPDITKSGLYKVKRTESGSHGSRVILSLSPSKDKDIFTVYCVATQPDVHTTDIQKKIDIFPERERNWDLVEKISNMIYN